MLNAGILNFLFIKESHSSCTLTSFLMSYKRKKILNKKGLKSQENNRLNFLGDLNQKIIFKGKIKVNFKLVILFLYI